MFPPAGRLRSSIRKALHGSETRRETRSVLRTLLCTAPGHRGHAERLARCPALPPDPTLCDSAAGSHALPAASERPCPRRRAKPPEKR